jgi:hypothetical protein
MSHPIKMSALIQQDHAATKKKTGKTKTKNMTAETMTMAIIFMPSKLFC